MVGLGQMVDSGAASADIILWQADAKRSEASNIVAFMRWLGAQRDLKFEDYDSLWRWSTSDVEAFWSSFVDYCGLRFSSPPTAILENRQMPGAKWFPGATLNYAEQILRQATTTDPAFLYCSEQVAMTRFEWPDLASQVRVLASWMRKTGIEPGDRVCAYLPNGPQAVVALLATAAIGAIWASVSPDFGADGTLDRISQLRPKLLFCIDGYRYGGKPYDRRQDVKRIIEELDDLIKVVQVPNLDLTETSPIAANAVIWNDIIAGADPVHDFEFAQVPFDHPLWILFTSGTTGLPKAIVHGHGGIILEMLKNCMLHKEIRRGERTLNFSTTGWMMWNGAVSGMLCGAVPVFYDGSPGFPDVDTMWRFAEQSGAANVTISPRLLEMMRQSGSRPRENFDLSRLVTVMPAGSPVTPEQMVWLYAAVGPDLWVCPGSGGTDCCTGFMGGVLILPVRAGEMQARSLGVAAAAFDEDGRSVIDEVGELVITQPMPSMPVMFWNDPDNTKYAQSYFDKYPGKWRHGDLFRVNARGGCFVLGRSDATLNRYGIRIGTAEIYRTLAQIPQIDGSIITCLDLPDGGFFMPLFVTLKNGAELDDDLRSTISRLIARTHTARHVPDAIYQVPAIPLTLTGKAMEVPVRRLLLGASSHDVANPSAMANPEALDWFVAYAENQSDYNLQAV